MKRRRSIVEVFLYQELFSIRNLPCSPRAGASETMSFQSIHANARLFLPQECICMCVNAY